MAVEEGMVVMVLVVVLEVVVGLMIWLLQEGMSVLGVLGVLGPEEKTFDAGTDDRYKRFGKSGPGHGCMAAWRMGSLGSLGQN